VNNLDSIAIRVRDLLLKETEGHSPCAILLSNGVDSNSILASLIRNERNPYVISFRLKGSEPTDWLMAKKTAEKLYLRFIDIELPKDLEIIFKDVKFAIQKMDLSKKADIECAIPVKYALDRALKLGIQDVYTGVCADGHYAVSRKAQIAVKKEQRLNDPTFLEEYRTKYFQRENPAQSKTMKLYFESKGGRLFMPYLNPEFHDIYKGISFEQMNKPKEKMPIRIAFPEMSEWKVGARHINLQLGNSGIASNFERLLDSEYNIHDNRAVIGIYNAIARGEL
jgi:asparagine synthetase B (glutamine-hydrolysing)